MSGSRMAEPSVGGRVYAHTKKRPERVTYVRIGAYWTDETGCCMVAWEDLEDPSPI